ncbi:transposase IS4 family protein [Xylanimonas cellulosilytica DSM 15894]|uniref:Transposase IS4 family protein n=1 Tax=Xylanimonas cellulosilytica (strain DSM 15894 / JCM 12276 / CECT 5975 / KCTC 9989 / LMG 20990 / NBRC 107835 / XIL07) TaxID=446471 RepID=D1BSD0_XYLCX|nr:ISAs1 family transposase [Xylanimonas cellulosilytica]ACZ30622.1 transposase IS4 family protein [Xylanimonas cellulosilytica DSM 15894]
MPEGAAPVSVVSPVLAVLDQSAVTGPVLGGQVEGLLEAFAQVPDPRKRRGVRFGLPVVLGLALLAVACGAVGFAEIAEVAADLDPELTAAFGLVRCAPSAATFRRVLCTTDPTALDEALCRWAQARARPDAAGQPPPAPADGQRRVRVISADGKTMRGARRRTGDGKIAQDQVVEILDHASGAVVACEPVNDGDEIGAVRTVMGRLADRWGSLAGVVVVTDAKHTQHKLVEQVGAVGGWWLLPVKANQPRILAKVRALPWAQVRAQDTCRGKAHGRAETRTVRVVQAPTHVDLALAGTAQVIKITRHTRRRPHPGAPAASTRENAYLLTSLPAEVADPATLAAMVRSHWLIENQVHWVRDTAYDEDRHTARTGNGPINLACLRNTAITRHRAHGASNIAKALRASARHARRALDALTQHQTLKSPWYSRVFVSASSMTGMPTSIFVKSTGVYLTPRKGRRPCKPPLAHRQGGNEEVARIKLSV